MARADHRNLPVLLAAGVALPLIVAAASGALLVSHNDDFNYRRVALDLYHEGRIQLTGWTVMSLIGQLFLVQPFLWISGGAAWAFGVMTSVGTVVGIVASYVLVRLILPPTRAFIAVLVVVVFPGFLLNTTSFMTDVPAYAGEMLCLAIGARALRQDGTSRWRWIVASLAVGWFAFSIREFALAAPVAVLVVNGIPAGRRRGSVLAGVALLAVCGLTYYVTSHLPGQGTSVIAPISAYSVSRMLSALATLTLGISPALVIGGAWWIGRAHLVDSLIGAIVGVGLYFGQLTTLVAGGGVPAMLIGNLLVQEGAPGSGAMAGDRPLLFTSPTWEALNVVALLSAVVGFAVLGAVIGTSLRRGHVFDRHALPARIGSTTGLLIVFTVIFAGGLTLFGLIAAMFDRYLWPLALPISALLLLRPTWAEAPNANDDEPTEPPEPTEPRAHRRSAGLATTAIATILLAGLTATALALFLNSSAFDAARWQMGEAAAARGIARGTVDAGMEWVGYNATGTANIFAPPVANQMWYTAWWPSFRQCALVSSSLLAIPGFTLEQADIEAYRLLLVAGPETPLYLYRVAGPGCA